MEEAGWQRRSWKVERLRGEEERRESAVESDHTNGVVVVVVVGRDL